MASFRQDNDGNKRDDTSALEAKLYPPLPTTVLKVDARQAQAKISKERELIGYKGIMCVRNCICSVMHGMKLLGMRSVIDELEHNDSNQYYQLSDEAKTDLLYS